jgi:hypothetical protein
MTAIVPAGAGSKAGPEKYVVSAAMSDWLFHDPVEFSVDVEFSVFLAEKATLTENSTSKA